MSNEYKDSVRPRNEAKDKKKKKEITQRETFKQ